MQMLLGYYLLYFALVFVFPTWRLWRRTGVNGLVVKFDDSAEGYVGRWFRVVMIGVFVLLGAAAVGIPQSWLGPLP